MHIPGVLLTNQYPVLSSLELRRSDYLSTEPQLLAARWQEKGWMAMEHRGHVRVYHGAQAPGLEKDIAASRLLPLQESGDTLMALNGTLRRALTVAGYTYRGPNKHTIFTSHDGRNYPSGVKYVQLYRHRTWTWAFEFQGDTCWFVPRPTWTKVTALPAAMAAPYLERRFQNAVWTVVDVRTGEAWPRLTTQEIRSRIWASPSDIRILYRPSAGSDDGQPSVADIHRAVEDEVVLTQVADVTRPRQLPQEPGYAVPPPQLVIRKTHITERKETIKRGVHRKPLRPVILLSVLPKGDQEARLTLIYRFGPSGLIKTLGMPIPITCVSQIWDTKWKLKTSAPRSMIKTPVAYDPVTGCLSHPHRLEEAAARAAQENCTLVTVIVRPRMPLTRDAWTTLHTAVRPFNPVSLESTASSTGEEQESEKKCWGTVTQIALKVLRAAGGVPYELRPLPETTSGTYYLGLDVSTRHRENRSVVGMVLVNWRGHVVDTRLVHLDENNERIPTAVLTELLPAWLAELSADREYDRVRRLGAVRPIHLVVHRDGQFMADEAEELQSALSHIPRLDLVAVKKSPTLRVQAISTEPQVVPLSERTAVILSTAALEGRVKPLEIRVLGTTSLMQAAIEVLWLSEMRTDQLYLPGRLPLTTFLADRLAGSA